jgi:hypothetical protein
MSQWTYAQNGQQFGPVTSTQLKQLAAQGQLGGNDLVWREGMTEWAQAGTVKGLFAAREEPRPVVADNSQPAEADSAIPYYSPTSGLSPRVRHTLQGYPPPTGQQDDWPLSDQHLSQLKETEKLRRQIRNCAMLYNILCIIYTIAAAILLVAGLFTMGSSGRGASFEGGFVLAFSGVAVGLALLAFFAKGATQRCRKWAPITFTVLFSLGGLLYLIDIFISLIADRSDFGTTFGAVVGLLFAGAFIHMSVRALVAMPKFLASPVWAQEALVNAKL